MHVKQDKICLSFASFTCYCHYFTAAALLFVIALFLSCHCFNAVSLLRMYPYRDLSISLVLCASRQRTPLLSSLVGIILSQEMNFHFSWAFNLLYLLFSWRDMWQDYLMKYSLSSVLSELASCLLCSASFSFKNARCLSPNPTFHQFCVMPLKHPSTSNAPWGLHLSCFPTWAECWSLTRFKRYQLLTFGMILDASHTAVVISKLILLLLVEIWAE